MKKHQLLPTSLAPVLLLTCLAVATAWADYSNTVASYHPVGYWRFNETAAAPDLNQVTNYGTLGSTAYGYVVMDVGKGEPGALGTLGHSIRLTNPNSDTGTCNTKVDVPFNTGLNTPNFTIEFWAKPASISTEATGVCPISSFNQNWYAGANRSGWLFYVNNQGRWNFRMGLTSGYALNLQASASVATVGTWQHIVSTYDGTTARVYANGIQIATGNVSSSRGCSTGFRIPSLRCASAGPRLAPRPPRGTGLPISLIPGLSSGILATVGGMAGLTK